MMHTTDPRTDILDAIGDIDDIEIFNNQVLCAVYIRPKKTASGIYLTDSTVDEDRHQGKVGLILKMGAAAFEDPTNQWFGDEAREGNNPMSLGDWAVFRPSDGWSITINGVLCRILDDTNIRGRIQAPDQVW